MSSPSSTTIVNPTRTTKTGANLIKEFTTFFGDTFNGLWVTWGHDSKATGDRIMDIKLTANLYAAVASGTFLFG
jgi:hypothetical protein